MKNKYENFQNAIFQNERLQHETLQYKNTHYNLKQNKNFKIKNSEYNVFQKPNVLLSSEAFGVTIVANEGEQRVDLFRDKILKFYKKNNGKISRKIISSNLLFKNQIMRCYNA